MNMMIGKSGWDLKEGYLLQLTPSNLILAFFLSLQVISYLLIASELLDCFKNYHCKLLIPEIGQEEVEERRLSCIFASCFPFFHH